MSIPNRRMQGSAAWPYRAGIESILGFRKQGNYLLLSLCIPREWPRFEIVYTFRTSRYHIAVENPDGVSRGVLHASVDGAPLPIGATRFLLLDDGAEHRVQ